MDKIFALIGGRLIDGTGSEPVNDSVIKIKNGLVEEVGNKANLKIDPKVESIDISNMTVLPGLIDCHVHLSTAYDPADSNVMTSILMTPPPLAALWGLKNANLCLEAGFTTIRDLGGFFNWDNIEIISLRRAIEMDLVQGPRILAGGVMAQTASHLELSGLGRLSPWINTDQGSADGPWEIRKRVRRLISLEADFIKVFASGYGGVVERAWWPNYTLEELTALCDEAHRYKKKVAAHVTSPDSIIDAAKAGCDTLEHLIDIDEEGLDLMAENDIFAVPTLSLFSDRALSKRSSFDTVDAVDQIRRTGELSARTFERVHAHGIKVAMGTDTFRTVMPGDNADELSLMVKFGMNPMESIVASTKNAAEAIDRINEIGTIEKGKDADLIIIDGDPLEDINILQNKKNINIVMKSGEILVDRR